MKVTKTGKINYSNIPNPQATFGIPIGRNRYNYDEDGNLTSYPDGLINAVDINWGGAEVKSSQINTTDDLLELVNDLGSIHADINDDNVVNVIIGSIRALQAEVAKLRNSFRFGINSYTDENFGMSQTVDELNNITEEEPLWATDESELSYIHGLDLSLSQFELLEPVSNYAIIQNEKLGYSGELICNISNEKFNALNEVTDPKLYIYLTSSSKKVKIKIKNETNQEYYIDINNIVDTNYLPDKYNILCILSRKVLDEKDNKYKGNNFAWVSISEYSSGQDIFNGYIDIDNDSINYVTSQTPVYSSNRWIYDSIIFDEPNEGVTEYIYKLDIYSKYQDFKTTIEAATPTNVEDYKYCTAHLTIRSMSTYEKIESHINELQNNELIFCEGNKKLYIYTNGKIINIGSSSSGSDSDKDTRMENYEIIKALAEQGLITIKIKDETYTNDSELYDPSNIDYYKLNNVITINDIEEINFINGDTGKEFNVTMNPYGEFNIKEILDDNKSLASEYATEISNLPGDYESDRSFVSLIKVLKKNLDCTKDVKLDADRVQIGSIYAPLKTDKMYGCTHGYIELFNSSDEDFYLDGCYLHYSCVDNASASTKAEDVKYYKLPLKGYIPAGGTYLIRCKKYCDFGDINTYIDVNKYDLEWYIDVNNTKELLDISMTKTGSYQYLLTYGDTIGSGASINQSTIVAKAKTASNKPKGDKAKDSGKGLYYVIKGFIDSCRLGNDWGNQYHWVPAKVNPNKDCQYTIGSNTIYKVTFAMDPAKQAFNSMTTSDSSRQRWQNAANDYQYVQLDKPYIEFPKTDIKKAVADYAPKASFEHKNVMIDKTQFDKTKPNAIVCSYGINPYTTRCFNWLSHGSFDEAVVIIDPDTNKEHIFSSYVNRQLTHVDASGDTPAYDYDKDYDAFINTEHPSYPRKKIYQYDINNIVYGSGGKTDAAGKRLYNKFPGNELTYTSHKCVIELCSDYTYDSTMTAKTYKYYICRLNKFGKKDESYKSDIKEFTLYPKNYTPKVYQITDQQGFHWIEYQVWAASAKKLYEKIQSDITAANGKLMPIIINTGDAVQSGARLNEWIDYFEAGKYLFDHFEQNNIVGNNDLCDTDITILGTGDDSGKSNGYFFHLFNCYDVNNDPNKLKYLPIVNGKYVPSLYYVDINISQSNINRILFINSEITVANCKDWFNLVSGSDTVNIYTGYTINKSNQQYVADTLGFTPIYEILYHWTSESYGYLPVCHEMPFTVVTNACLSWTNANNQFSRYRSLSDAATAKLIGSHCNQISEKEDGKGLHWMSRLFEYRGITLCLGGHKHTYACTYPVRENYLYTEDEVKKWSYMNGPMTMPASLKDDTAEWSVYAVSDDTKVNGKVINLSKFPIVKRPDEHKTLDTSGSMNVTVDVKENVGTDNERTVTHTVYKTNNSIDHTDWIVNDEFVQLTQTEGSGDNAKTVNYYVYKLNTETSIEYELITSEDATPKIYKCPDNASSVYTLAMKNNNYMPETVSIGFSKSFKVGKKNGDTYEAYNFPAVSGYTNNVNIQMTSMDTKESPQRFYPFIDKNTNDTNNFVIYLMCQATGYKLTSNKELPSEFQKFSMVIPKSYIDPDSDYADKPSQDQTMPMYTITEFAGKNQFKVQLGRINNISNSQTKMEFTQSKYNTGLDNAKLEYLILSKTSINGIWCHYDSKTSQYVQDDKFKSSKVAMHYVSGSTTNFNVNDNADKILYTDLVTASVQYLIDTTLL